jgi:hypothetical protein
MQRTWKKLEHFIHGRDCSRSSSPHTWKKVEYLGIYFSVLTSPKKQTDQEGSILAGGSKSATSQELQVWRNQIGEGGSR